MKSCFSTLALFAGLLSSEVLLAQTTTINFDNVGNGVVINNQYASSGVTFKCYKSGKAGNVCTGDLLAVSQPSSSAPNVIGLTTTATGSFFNENTGYAVAVFTNPVSSVSVSVSPRTLAEIVDSVAAKSNKPYLQVFGPFNPSTGKNPFLTTVYVTQDLTKISTATPGSWETLSVSHPANDIGMVVLSSGFASGAQVFGTFDNLTFTTLTRKLTVAVAGQGKVSSSPSGIATPGATSANFTAGSTVVLTATPAAPTRAVSTKKIGSRVIKLPMVTTYTFDGWSGAAQACPSTQTTCSITLDVDKSVTATFSSHTAPLQPIETTP